MLRDIFVISLLLIGFFCSLRRPFWALLFYLWLGYFRPEYWIWNGYWLKNLNLSFIVGFYILLRAPFAGLKFRFDLRAVLLFSFLGLDVISTLTSPYSAYSRPFLEEFIKVITITYLMTRFTSDPSKYRLVVLAIAMSLGFETSKQGWLDLFRHPGAKNINTINFLGDENEVAVGLLMLVPLLLALAQTASRQWERRLHQFVGIGVFYRAIITYSRGGFLACGAMGVMHILRSKHKVRSLVGAMLVAALIYPVLPADFWERMSTIPTSTDVSAGTDLMSDSPVPDNNREARNRARDERSSQSRFHFWAVARRMANANPILGVGHNAYHAAYDSYDFLSGEYGGSRAVHSVWFGLLAELGYPGISLFVLILALAIVGTQRTINLAEKGLVPAELAPFAIAIQTGCAVFIVGGSFVSWQYDEMLWHFIGLSMALQTAATAVPRTVPAVEEPVTTRSAVRFEPAQAIRGT